MNDQDSPAPETPSTDSLAQSQPRPRARKNPMADEPMQSAPGMGAILEALLKQPGALLHELNGPRQASILWRLLALVVLCAGIYGLVMGSLSGGAQLWAAPLKLTIGFLFSILLCLPSLYIFLCLNGADLRLGQICGALLGVVSLVGLLLIGFAPVSWIFSQSTDSVVVMGALHLVFWIIGLWFGLRFIKGLLACGEADDGGHLKVWTIIFIMVSLQMTSVLRPLIGTADTFLPTEKKFFVQHWMDNLN